MLRPRNICVHQAWLRRSQLGVLTILGPCCDASLTATFLRTAHPSRLLETRAAPHSDNTFPLFSLFEISTDLAASHRIWPLAPPHGTRLISFVRQASFCRHKSFRNRVSCSVSCFNVSDRLMSLPVLEDYLRVPNSVFSVLYDQAEIRWKVTRAVLRSRGSVVCTDLVEFWCSTKFWRIGLLGDRQYTD